MVPQNDNTQNASEIANPAPAVPDIVRLLSTRNHDTLASLTCFAVDSAVGGEETYVDIDCSSCRAQVTYISKASPIKQLQMAEEIIGYLKECLIAQAPKAKRPNVA